MCISLFPCTSNETKVEVSRQGEKTTDAGDEKKQSWLELRMNSTCATPSTCRPRQHEIREQGKPTRPQGSSRPWRLWASCNWSHEVIPHSRDSELRRYQVIIKERAGFE